MSKRVTYDASGLKCPLPVLKARREMEGLKSGDILEITTTDDASRHDIPSWANEVGHKVINTDFNENRNIFEVKKA